VILPDSSLLAHYVMRRGQRLLAGMNVNADQMRANLDSSHGLVFSQGVLLALVQAGMSRDDAYRIVQTSALRAWDEHTDFRALLEADPEVAALGAAALDIAFDLPRSLRNIGPVFVALDQIEV
jgi:adenylosuccinate lyase